MSAEQSPTSLVVVSYDKLPYTRLCLERMLECSPCPAQVIVVDNGSQDGSHDYLARDFLRRARTAGVDYVLLANAGNVGACTARNQALELADQPYVAFADNDLVPGHPDWLARLAGRLGSDERLGIVGPKLLFPFAPYVIECAGVAISPAGRVQYRGRGEPASCLAEPQPVQCLISACWLMKRQVVEEIGPLDEAFNPAQFEDFDFCYRARSRGWEVWYEPAAEMYHFENTTTAGSTDFHFQHVTLRNWSRFRSRWREQFTGEGGPPDAECVWRDLPRHTWEEVGAPPWR